MFYNSIIRYYKCSAPLQVLSSHLAAEVREGATLVGEGGVVHDVPVEHIELVVGHRILVNKDKDLK